MPTAPDPLVSDPAIRRWAEKFFAIKAWTPANPVPLGDDPVSQRRAVLQKRLDGVAISADLPAGARRSFAGGRKALGQSLRDAKDMNALNAVEGEIGEIEKDLAEQGLVAAARVKAVDAMATAENACKTGRPLLDQGGLIYIEGLMASARKDLAKAVSRTDFEGVETAAKNVVTKLADATAFGTYADQWGRVSVQMLPVAGAGDRQERTDAREKARTTSIAKSTTGDFAGARVELDKWQSSGTTDTATFGAAVLFEETLATYRATQAGKCEIVLASVIEDAKAFKGSVEAAEKLAKANKPVEAKKKIDDLVAFCTPRVKLAQYLRRIGQVSNSIPDLRAELLKMQATQKADPDKALEDLKAYLEDKNNEAIQNQNFSLMVSKTLEARYTALHGVAGDPLKAELKKVWDEHNGFVAAKTVEGYQKAAALLPRINTLFQFEKTIDREKEIDKILKDHPATVGYGLHTAYKDALAGKHWVAAQKAVPDTLDRLRHLVAYLPRKAAAEEVQALLPVDPPDVRANLSNAINAAEATAKADPAKAKSDLDGVLNGTDYMDLALEIADFRAKLAEVKKEQAKTLKYLTLPAGVEALRLSLEAAQDLGDTQHKYGDAFLALELHARLLKDANAMATAYRQARGVIAGLKRAKSDVSAFEPRLIEAEKEAGKPDFAKARTLFEGLLKDMDGACRLAADAYEQADEHDCNAGHSLDRHGYDVSEEDLIKRLTTGIPPNPKTDKTRSYTQASTQFENPQDWLAGREIAAEAARNLPPGKRVDIDEKVQTYDPDADPAANPPEKAEFTIDHGRPIDQGFVGLKKSPVPDDEGKFKNYETFEKVEGLTRAKVGFVWVPDSLPDENVLGIDYEKMPKQKPDGSWETWDNKAYATEYLRRRGAKPGTIKGRWVMMQQFPIAEGWDNELKAYTTDQDDLIP